MSTLAAHLRRIVLLGPPASGKGTQAELIQATFGLPITSTGAMLREEKRLGTRLGFEADRLTREGQFVSDDLIVQVIAAWLEAHDSAFVFDGFPRTLGQASSLQEMLSRRGTPLEAAFALEVDRAQLQARVASRMVCTVCGQIVGLGLQISASSDSCPRCGGTLGRRDDDTPETLAIRLEVYREKTEPLLAFYENLGLLHRINSACTPAETFASIRAIIEQP